MNVGGQGSPNRKKEDLIDLPHYKVTNLNANNSLNFSIEEDETAVIYQKNNKTL